MKKALIILLAAGLVVGGYSQDRLQKKESSAVNAAAPVTEAEANQVLSQLEKAVYRLLRRPAPPSEPASGSAKPATRDMVFARLNSLFDTAKPQFKFTPRKVKYNPSLIAIPKTNAMRDEIEKLIAWGFVAKVGPLVTSPKPTFTPKQMGDAVGMFMARVADLTHTPNSRWSPYISPGNPDSPVEGGPEVGKGGGGL